jgi:hypothetical protein
MSGYYKMHRGWWDHPAFGGDPKRIIAWEWMIANAAWRSREEYQNGVKRKIARGQLVTSLRQLASDWEKWGFTLRHTRTLIARLESDTMIATQSDTRGMVITICN